MQIEEAIEYLKMRSEKYKANKELMSLAENIYGAEAVKEYDKKQEAIETVLNELEKKDKVIDLLADDLRYYEGMQQDQLFCIDTCEGKMCDEEHCKERIKEYFYKKVE